MNIYEVKLLKISRKFCVAPMLDWTDRHCRYFLRLISQHSVLYSEMITTGAILYGDTERHLAMSTQEQPVALQLGGSDPKDLAATCKIAANYAYSEINLNCGCPSDRVQNGMFGAVMMKDAEIIRLFDQNLELVIEGLAARSGRDFKEVLLLLQKGRKLHGTHDIR